MPCIAVEKAEKDMSFVNTSRSGFYRSGDFWPGRRQGQTLLLHLCFIFNCLVAQSCVFICGGFMIKR